MMVQLCYLVEMLKFYLFNEVVTNIESIPANGSIPKIESAKL